MLPGFDWALQEASRNLAAGTPRIWGMLGGFPEFDGQASDNESFVTPAPTVRIAVSPPQAVAAR